MFELKKQSSSGLTLKEKVIYGVMIEWKTAKIDWETQWHSIDSRTGSEGTQSSLESGLLHGSKVERTAFPDCGLVCWNRNFEE